MSLMEVTPTQAEIMARRHAFRAKIELAAKAIRPPAVVIVHQPKPTPPVFAPDGGENWFYASDYEATDLPVRHIPNYRMISIVQRRICAEHNIALEEMTGDQRNANLVRARHIAIYIAKTITGWSLPMIGRRFGDRDHTTVLHACRNVVKWMAAEPDLSEHITHTLAELRAGR